MKWFLALISTLVLSCGDKQKVEQLPSLKGTQWSGQLQPLSGANLTTGSLPVSLSFGSDDTFKAIHLNDVSKKASGIYRDMPRHNTILMDVRESNFEQFSASGTSKALEYSLQGEELVLKNQEGIYTMIRGESDGRDPTNGFLGSWKCEDDRNGKWEIDFETEGFFARRTEEGKRAMSLYGNPKYSKSDKERTMPNVVLIQIQAGSAGGASGILLKGKKADGKEPESLALYEALENGDRKPKGIEIECQR